MLVGKGRLEDISESDWRVPFFVGKHVYGLRGLLIWFCNILDGSLGGYGYNHKSNFNSSRTVDVAVIRHWNAPSESVLRFLFEVWFHSAHHRCIDSFWAYCATAQSGFEGPNGKSDDGHHNNTLMMWLLRALVEELVCRGYCKPLQESSAALCIPSHQLFKDVQTWVWVKTVGTWDYGFPTFASLF